MRVSTKTGDDGMTSLFGGGRVSKASARIEACGAVDELNAFIGFARAVPPIEEIDAMLGSVQEDLFALGAHLAAAPGKRGTVPRLERARTERLEREMDTIEPLLEPLRTFIVPGGSETAARIHLCRVVCRRTERAVVGLAEREKIDPETIRYLNRLSDFLFLLARYGDRAGGVPRVRNDP
ncbi:MAG: cob(I)yrinic acid a,c-diamide adenosyltransferase [Bacteroidota bacterium]|nr:cob(I)yrinic acid a,c-diamide adenosyltransferase [Bacteroidota bacterium]